MHVQDDIPDNKSEENADREAQEDASETEEMPAMLEIGESEDDNLSIEDNTQQPLRTPPDIS